MKKYGKLAALLALSVMVVTVGTGCGSAEKEDAKASEEKVLNVGIVQYMDHVTLDSARQGL